MTRWRRVKIMTKSFEKIPFGIWALWVTIQIKNTVCTWNNTVSTEMFLYLNIHLFLGTSTILIGNNLRTISFTIRYGFNPTPFIWAIVYRIGEPRGPQALCFDHKRLSSFKYCSYHLLVESLQNLFCIKNILLD